MNKTPQSQRVVLWRHLALFYRSVNQANHHAYFTHLADTMQRLEVQGIGGIAHKTLAVSGKPRYRSILAPTSSQETRMRQYLVTYRKWILAGAIPLLIALLWFTAVCSEWHIEVCDDCGAWNEFLSTNVVGWEVYREEIHTELNEPWDAKFSTCEHQHVHHRMKHRYWGLVFCWCPCQNGTDRLVQWTTSRPVFRLGLVR